MTNLYALLVGINNYHPDSRVGKLYGCVPDVQTMEAFLKKKYAEQLGLTENGKAVKKPPKRLKVLTDAQATREAIVDGFLNHLGEAKKEGDVALFYYAGHGSFENTSEQFERYDADKQNETLVCYDSRLPGHHDLADKEIAVLLNEIPDTVQKIVILDSCHSGSATRSAEELEGLGRSRHEPVRHDSSGNPYKRAMDSYIAEANTYYDNLYKNKQIVQPPSSRHILISACDRDEKASETLTNRGLFSTHLINVLEKQTGPISYNKLYLELRRHMLNQNAPQNPKIYTIGGFNANYSFLGTTPIDSNALSLTWNKKAEKWVMEQGAAHGLPTEPLEVAKIKLKIFTEGDGAADAKGVPATLASVGLNDSYLNVDGLDTSGNTSYVAKMDYLPQQLTLSVWVNGDKKEVDAFMKHYDKSPSANLTLSKAPRSCTYQVRIGHAKGLYGKEGLEILHNATGKLVQSIQGKDDQSVAKAVQSLNQIEKWERLRKLEKRPNPEILNAADIQIDFEQTDDEGKVLQSFDNNDVNLMVDEISKDEWGRVNIRFQATNRSNRDLHFNLVAFYPFYWTMHMDGKKIPANTSETIEIYTDEVHFPAPFEMELESGKHLFDFKEDELTDYYKLYISTQELTPSLFNQDPLPTRLDRTRFGKRAMGQTKAAPVHEDDWFTQSYSVTVSKNRGQIGKGKKDFGGISFMGHDSVKAKVSLGSIKNNSRDVSAFDELRGLEMFEGLELLNLEKTRSDVDKSIVELRGIEGDTDLDKNPLKVKINIPVEEEETLIPITHDGEFIIPLGDMERDDDGNPIVSINHIPDQPSEDRKRSATRAIKFAFLKAASPTTESVFKLRWVNPEAETTDKRSTADLEEKVKEAKKILLLVHGIIGDTLEMGNEAIKFALRDPEKQPNGFDVILTFDYENLSGPIESISEKLNELLEGLGLGADDGKEFYIVAHSMGGLVSRYLIENVRGGDNMVDRLILFGTPNGGSAFSKIPDLLQTLKQLLGIALNFLPINVNGIIGMIKQFEKIKKVTETYDELKDNETVKKIVEGVEQSEKFQSIKNNLRLFVTLKQMDPESDFLATLGANTAPTNTDYYIVAGDISNYKAQGGSWLVRLMDKVVTKVGKLVYYGVASDIAVSVKGIKHVPFDIKDQSTVICHHMNYFVDDNSVEKWKEYLFVEE